MGLSSLIALENVSLRFSIPHERVDSLRNVLLTFWKKRTYETFYALKDVSFAADPGEFLGIIGKNGAGKTVLLKIIAGIYRPTAGRVQVRGAVSSFLELWTGMQAELSGRDNIFLYGALLGLSRRRVREKFDEIIGFSELEPFIDLKLKHYSSGMQARLAFSVAIQADAPILLVDEVLAVGDADFQKKCRDVFMNLKREGKTILYVSHNLESIAQWCDRALLVRDGRVAAWGQTGDVLRAYADQPEAPGAERGEGGGGGQE
jgi:ABC-type polysaccharide/polyol phosphate transport system ATPase subunit